MPRAWLREWFLGCTRVRRHFLVPHIAAEPLRVLDEDGNWRTERAPMANAANQLDLVLLELLSRATAESQSPTGEFIGDVGDGDGQVGGQSFDDHHQRLTVTFAGGQVAHHAPEFYRWR